MTIQKYILIALLFLSYLGSIQSQTYINRIYIEQKDVFDTLQQKKILGAGIANSLHIMTKEYIIEDELLFKEDDIIDVDLIDETERNLRAMDIFSNVSIEFDSVGYDLYDVYVVAQDRWSTYPSFLFGVGGGVTSYGARLHELNFLGTATNVMVEGVNRGENDIGWEGEFSFLKKRIFRSEFALQANLLANRFRTDQQLAIVKPYRTLSTDFSYGIKGTNSFGSDFLYNSSDTGRLMPFMENRVSGWISRAWMREDRIFATVYTELHKVDRGDPAFRRAFDNSGKFLVAFSSVAQDFYKTNKVNTYTTEDLAIGGWGSALLGKIFPVGSKGESFYYVGGQGEQSYFDRDLYLFGHLSAGSAFTQAIGRYTYQEFYGLGFYRLSEDLLLAARIREQTTWNWRALRQLVLDNYTGLRGYDVNKLSGDNRLLGNVELRFFPNWDIWIFKLSGAVFYDIGTVWNQNYDLSKAKFHSALGFGLRFHDTKSSGYNSIFRLDFAFNFDEKKFGGIIFTTDQLFSAFGSHRYRIPNVLGTEFDYQ